MGKVMSALTSVVKGPKMPTQTPATTPIMPDPENVQAKLAARKKAESRLKEGRAGTIYTQGYSGNNLGGTA